MKFRVIKSSLDGVSGGDAVMSINEACREISYSKGWDSLDQLHKAIRKWAKSAEAGDVFKTAASVIVAASGIDEIESVDVCPECDCDNLNFEELSPVEDGGIEQEVSCPQCGHHWMDVFTLTERRELAEKEIA